MRIGVTNLFKGSAFSGAMPQVAVYLAYALKELGHDVEYVIPGDSDDWFVDCLSLAKDIPITKLINNSKLQTYHLIVEVVWFLPPDLRKQLTQRSAMFYHYPPVFYDIESSTYPLSSQTRDFTGLNCIWTWSNFKKTDYEYLEMLSGCPVFTLPFLWNPILVDAYCAEAAVPKWTPGRHEIIICESNETNTSHCTLPLTIVSEICRTEPATKWRVTNSDTLLTRPFFVTNVVRNLHFGSDISGNFLKRVRLPDLCRAPTVLLSHQRWRPMKYHLLDALWLGIPVIHNCEALRTTAGGQWFYNLNRIGQALVCWNRIRTEPRPELSLVRADLLSKWGPAGACTILPTVLVNSVTCSKPVRHIQSGLRIAFLDMWADFVPQHNLFVSALRAHGGEFEIDQIDPNVIIFGPFGAENENPRFKNIPKIYYVGENMGPREREDVVLNIGFMRDVETNYIRLPNWMLELNWFSQNSKEVVNPEPLPLELLSPIVQKRDKFCAFVASNPNCVERNTLFHLLSRYKSIDSGGSLFGTIDKIPCGSGGSRGQVAKVEFYKQYKFVLACENSKSPGYVTEKILHAKLAGCIPIYWGDPHVALEFNPKAFINVAEFASEEALIRRIKELDEDDIAWTAMASEKILSDEQIVGCRAIWKQIADRIIGIKKICVPALAAAAAVPVVPPYKTDFIGECGGKAIVTCCNSAYVSSAVRLIKSANGLPVYVFVWNTNSSEDEELELAGGRVVKLDTKWNPGWDFWNPAHYAWKPLVLHVANCVFAKGTLLLYLDSGIEVLRDLSPIWSEIEQNDIFVTHMPEHTMQTWSHPRFCELLEMTEAEGRVAQYSANIFGFKVDGKFRQLFNDVYKQACRRDVIVGNKWAAYSNVCKGHRHDQSIYTLLGHRAGVKPLLLDSYAGWTNHTDCVESNKFFYVHRGNWTAGRQRMEGFDASYIVNLAHREDRLLTFKNNHSVLAAQTQVVRAVYGRDIQMTAEIAHLFRDNDFKWKKSVMGCALSHYEIWKQIVASKAETCLVLEDDVAFVGDYVTKWNQMIPDIPKDAHFIFLGGVLPPNKPALPLVTEPVNKSFAKVKPHALFGGVKRRYFHFCTYSYIITRAGAERMCALIEERGIFTSIDHMIVNHGDSMLNLYFSCPLLAGCLQDADPAYQNADFNNFNRVDKFDSEIWNNTDAFTEDEVRGATTPIQVVYFDDLQSRDCLEQEWLEEVFARKFKWIKATDTPTQGEPLFICYQHTVSVDLIEGWINRHMDHRLYLIHLSDETCKDNVSLYRHPGIRAVFRNYWRPDVNGPKVIHIPLGYYGGRSSTGLVAKISERPTLWSFAGAMDRPGRAALIESFKAVPGYKLHLTPTWHSNNLEADKYNALLKESKFIPCLAGFYNVESYRFYEALEHGALPLIPIDKNESYTHILNDGVEPILLGLREMETAAQVMSTLSSRTAAMDKIQIDMRNWWIAYKQRLTKRIWLLIESTKKSF